MFLPPNSSHISDEPEEVALKTILMWNGLGQWRGLRGGRYNLHIRFSSHNTSYPKTFFIHYRGEFVKQKCPVSTCVLTSDRKQQNTADLIFLRY